MKRILPLLVALAACGTFEDETVVIDLRVLAMRTLTDSGHADMVVDVDLASASLPLDIAHQLEPTTVRVLVADPGNNRQLRWDVTLCLANTDNRCDYEKPHLPFGSGILDDPELSPTAQVPSPQLLPEAAGVANTMVAMILQDIEDNPINALGGVNLLIQFTVNGVDEPHSTDVYATKKLRISPRIPAGRTANTNPTLDKLDQDSPSGAVPGAFNPGFNGDDQGRCRGAAAIADPASIPSITSGDIVTLYPVESASTREVYVTPGLDGSSNEVTETIGYQWLATDGSWSDATTGGGHDVLGNQSLLGSDWRAPNVSSGSKLVTLWIIQRDERLGTTWLEGCYNVWP